MLRSIAELAAYGTFAALLTAASLAPQTGDRASSASTSNTATSNSATPLEPASTLAVERGALLFATKGCIGCHTHSAFPSARMQVGPELTGLPLRAATRVAGLDARAYVRQSLREPGAYSAASTSTAAMPELKLSDEDVEALSAFLLTSTR
jgi:mono/diheme cytochrome c family protein